jgi:hypothetical protein
MPGRSGYSRIFSKTCTYLKRSTLCQNTKKFSLTPDHYSGRDVNGLLLYDSAISAFVSRSFSDLKCLLIEPSYFFGLLFSKPLNYKKPLLITAVLCILSGLSLIPFRGFRPGFIVSHSE